MNFIAKNYWRQKKKGLVYVINTDFKCFLRTENVERLGAKNHDKRAVDLSDWKVSCLGTLGGARRLLVGDCFCTPWYKLALGFFDGLSLVSTYWKAIDEETDLNQAIAAAEYQLCRRQLHICTSVTTISRELESQGILKHLLDEIDNKGVKNMV